MNRLSPLVLCSLICVLPRAQADEAAAMAILRAGCSDDVQRLCTGVQPGGGRLIACLKDHKDALSDQCKQAAQKATAMNGANPAAPSGTQAPTAPPSSNAAPLGAPSVGDSEGAGTSHSATVASSASAASKAPSKSSASADKHTVTASDTSAHYLRLRKAQIMLIMSTEPNAKPKPEVEMLIPASWDFEGGLLPTANLKSGCFSDSFPVGIGAHAPDGSAAFQKVAESSWQYSDDPQEMKNLTDRFRRAYGGNGKVCPVGKPLTAEQYFRENLMPPSATLISIDPYPELIQIVRQQLGLGPNDNPDGLRIDAIRAHVEFEGKSKPVEGKPMEGWLTTAVVTRTFAVGRGHLYDMRAVDLMSLIALKGQLAGNEKLFRVMMSSIRVMPEFAEFTNKQIAQYYQLQANKEAKIDQINARLQNDITQTYLHMSENAAHASRQGFLAADQNLRGVQTFRDPSTGHTMELSSQYDHAWLNGNDQYIMSDDPNFNPNTQVSGNWSRLQAVPPSD